MALRGPTVDQRPATQASTHSSRPFGGVSAQRHKPALKHFVQEPDDLAAAAPHAGAHPKFKYHGGPIVSTPKVHASLWGDA